MDDQVRKKIGHLIIRADANTQIGIGHLMRCLSLGQAWKEAGGQVICLTTCFIEELQQRMAKEKFTVYQVGFSYPDLREWPVTENLLSQFPGGWLVLDGYHFDPAYQLRVKEKGYKLLVIDDMVHLPFYHADVVLNQNFQASDLYYSCKPETRLLRGPAHALLRREFLRWRGWKREIPEVALKILVSLGGGDPDNVTLKVVRALKQIAIPGMEVSIVVGPANPHLSRIQEERSSAPFPIHLLYSTGNMSELMAWADLAIAAAGTTTWELAFMGLPGILLVIADNQRGPAEKLQKEGVFPVLGLEPHWAEPELVQCVLSLMGGKKIRQEMSQKGRLLVDGLGTNRVLQVLASV
ncbi:MAG: UDP-2,4-diacetamido-2,4,6-trideoxy-beta-L-altropyranose hydrolase [Deltaproteobacteria bacterium]